MTPEALEMSKKYAARVIEREKIDVLYIFGDEVDIPEELK